MQKKKQTPCLLLIPARENESQRLPEFLDFMLNFFHFRWPSLGPCRSIPLKKNNPEVHSLKIAFPPARLVHHGPFSPRALNSAWHQSATKNTTHFFERCQRLKDFRQLHDVLPSPGGPQRYAGYRRCGTFVHVAGTGQEYCGRIFLQPICSVMASFWSTYTVLEGTTLGLYVQSTRGPRPDG